MKKKLAAILLAFGMSASLAACGGGGETTLSGMVVGLEGTVVSLVEMDASNMGSMDLSEGEMPEMPEGMEGFQGFDPQEFEGTFPEGENFQWDGGEMPEGMTPPEGMEFPEDMEFPDDMTMPEDGQMPEGGQMPGFGNMGGMNFGSMDTDMETKDVDIADAHISLEIDGGKASGTLDDIQPGSMVTITLNGKGEATYVLVSSQSFFGGSGFMPAN